MRQLRYHYPAAQYEDRRRLAFDCGEYGQVRVAANAVNAMVRVRWNWNASPKA